MVEAGDAAVGAERERLQAGQAGFAAAAALLVSLWMAAIAAPAAHGPLVAGWLLASVLALAATSAALPSLRRLHEAQLAAADRFGRLSAALSGLVSGAAGTLFLPSLPGPGRAALSIAACAGLAVAMTSIGRQGPAFRLQLACCAGQFALAWWRLDTPGTAGVAAAFAGFALLAGSASTSVDRLGRRVLAAAIENRRLAESLARARDRAVAADRAKAHFIAAASHDLRQPAAALSLTASLLRRQVTDPAVAPAMQGLERSIAAMNELLGQLLDLSRLETGHVKVETRPVDIDALVQDLLQEAAPSARARGLRLRAIRCGCELDCDPVLVSRMLRNLVDNALRHTARGGITIRARPVRARAASACEPSAFELSVSDTGAGIPAEHQGRIFDEHYQVAGEPQQRGGLGLGLAIVRRIAALHDVSIRLRSAPGRGSRFTLRFAGARWRPLPAPGAPAAREPSVPGNRGDRPIAPACGPQRGDPAPLAGRRLLLVEDDVALGDAFARWLEATGFEVLRAADAAGATALIDAPGRIDAAISDFRLPGEVDGIAVLERVLRHHPAAIRVLVSGEIDPALADRAAAAGLTLLSKPMEPRQLDRILGRGVG